MLKAKNDKNLPKGITLHKNGRYMGRFTYEGQRYTLYDDDLKRLEKSMNDMRYELEHGIYGDAKRMTMNQWFKIWLEDYKENTVKPSTKMSYQQYYNLYIRKTLGGKYIKDVRSIHIQKLCNDLAKRGLATNTISRVELVINGMLDQACKNDMILKNPCIGVVVPKIERKVRKVMTQQEQDIFIEHVNSEENIMFRTFCLLALGTGMRIGEILALSWDCIDYNKKTISIERTMVYRKDENGNYNFFFQTPKTKSSRRKIPLLDNVMFSLKKYQVEQRKYIQMIGELWMPKEEMENLIFTTKSGKPLIENDINRKIHKIINEINEKNPQIKLQQFSSHTLRHTFATRCFENGIPPKVVQEFLGHASIKMTMDLYTHVLNDTKQEEIKKLESVFKNA